MKAEGASRMALFGSVWAADFSQLKPRGHYAPWGSDETALSRYFRAMMWFGRTDLRLVEVVRGKQVFHREALIGALAFLELMTPETRQRYARIDETVTAFVGEHDALHVAQLDALRQALGVTKVEDLANRSDEELIRVVVDGHFGAQRIASQIQQSGHGSPAPLPLAFALFGQRYTVDSHVLSSVSHDRVASLRMMPSPLDVGYAALGNDRAAALLAPELTKHAYAPQLEQMRLMVDGHDTAFWASALGTSWLSALRALSPSKKELTRPAAAGLPAVFTTEAWGRRLLSAQLASWAELRHDTILYTKQSLTGGKLCEFPDAYVDPYPEVWARLGAYARKGIRVTEPLQSAYPKAYGPTALHAHFQRLEVVVAKLEAMARAERTGTPFTAEQMAFVNDAVAIRSVGCGSQEADGWYPSLFLSRASSLKVDVTIADVHTQPTDEGGADVGRVLHVATGFPRFMTVIVETCHGPRAYMGVVSAFHEQITEHYTRLRDPEWDEQIRKAPPADPSWMADLVAR